jgi:hypothetical protein
MTEKTTEIDINEATHAQLVHFAKLQNLELDDSWSKGQLLARIKKAHPHGTIRVPAEVEPVTTFIPDELKAAKETFRIVVSPSDDDPEGVVEGGVNGVSFRIQKGVEVEVSAEILGVLKNAVALSYDPQREGGLSQPRKVQAIPYTVLAR